MKDSWIILGLLLLLFACVIVLIIPWALGIAMTELMWVEAVLLLVEIFALVGCIALQAGWFPQKKSPEFKPQSPVIQTQKAEPSRSTEEAIEEKPSQTPVKETTDRGSKIIDIEGIGPVYAEKLNSINIYTTSDLLEAGATPLGRKELAEKTGISGKLILKWVNMADLFRIKGVGEEYSELLRRRELIRLLSSQRGFLRTCMLRCLK